MRIEKHYLTISLHFKDLIVEYTKDDECPWDTFDARNMRLLDTSSDPPKEVPRLFLELYIGGV